MLAEIVSVVKNKSQLQQWRNTDAVIDWFSDLKDKKRLAFIQFDVVNFYGSITPDLLKNAITFATRFTQISELTKSTIMQAANSFLCNDGGVWIKKESETFDITMGGFHGAEVCDLIGLFILSKLKHIIPNSGLYRDDGLAVSDGTSRQIENLKKKVCKVFQDNKLSCTIEANLKVVNFLDVTLDLNTGVYKPFMKENDTPVYVNMKSNHPPMVLKNIPVGVNNRLSRISSNEMVFNMAAPDFQAALDKSGYSHKLVYDPNIRSKKKKKNRQRKVTWFNPPYSANVKTNIGRDFLNILDNAFPPTNPLHKLFTRKSVKVSYKCMPNIAKVVAQHNLQVLQDDQQGAAQQPGCNCKDGPAACPVQGRCKTRSVVYRATVVETRTGKVETYTGVTGDKFKVRYKQHTSDFDTANGRSKTTLAGHIWNLKDHGEPYEVGWSIIDRANVFNPTTRKCRVCLKEKSHILYNQMGSTLNKRNEIYNTCMHRKQKLLVKVKI